MKLGKPDIIDWHDGVITAVVAVGDGRTPHLCLTLAWSPDYDVRVYGLIPVGDAVASSIRGRLGETPASEGNWHEITNALAAVVSTYSGPVLVIATESVGEEILGQTAVPSAEIPELRLHANRMGTTCDEARLSDGRTLRYDLGVRPEYLFEFRLSPDGQAIIDSHYTRREHRELELHLPVSREDAKLRRAQLIELGVTATELREALGEPELEDRTGWWPYEWWTYPGGLTLELRLGVVEG
ncbi:MAG TPA: hypothetical protein VL326_03825 [Kofleriaceae bacterium]|nr:hypothetical protein [Kofleriaceae bacterium]